MPKKKKARDDDDNWEAEADLIAAERKINQPDVKPTVVDVADVDDGLLSIGRARGYLMASGPLIERIASAHVDQVSAAAAACRVNRDGHSFHVTLATKEELQALSAESQVTLEAALAKLRPSGIVSLGFGTVGRAKQKAYFVALLWPALQAARTSHGLPSSSPHITLGFDGADIHGCAKGALQLMQDADHYQPTIRNWDDVAAACRDLAASVSRATTAEALAEGVAAVSRLEAEASVDGYSNLVRYDLILSRSELQARAGKPAALWAADVEEAVQRIGVERADDATCARAWLMMARAMCAQRDWGEARDACRGAIHAAELSRHPLGDKFNEEASRLLEKIRGQIRAHNDAKRRVYTYVESQQMGPSVHAEDSKSLGCWHRRERYGATRYGWQVDPDSDEDVCLGRELT